MNIPDEVLNAATEAWWRDYTDEDNLDSVSAASAITLREATDAAGQVIAEWARKELEAENEKRRDEVAQLVGERDSLRQRLGAMTFEWGVGMGRRGPLIADDEETARLAVRHSVGSTPLMRRVVGPWTEVTR